MNIQEEEEIIDTMLSSAKTIAVVGLSDKPTSSSYGVALYLIKAGFKIIPVNPNVEEIFGLKSVSSLLAITETVDIVDIFRRPEYVPQIVEDAIAINAKGIWMQQGIEHEEAREKAIKAGIRVVMDRCISVSHRFYLHTSNRSIMRVA